MMAAIETLQDQVAALETTLGSATGMVGAFEGELAAAFPDARKGQDNGGDRDVAGSGDGA